MRRSMLCLLVLVVASTRLSATEDPPADEYVPQVVESKAVEPAAPAEESLHLTKVLVEKPSASDDAAAAQLGRRGSFWWMVGVIVVAGVILAIVL